MVIGPDTWTFRDDGTVVASGASDEPTDGRFEIDGDRMQLFLGAEGDVLLDVGFVLAAERLLLGALFPDGDVDGAVGAWSDTAIVNDEETHRAITLDADGSASSETDGEVETGTWEKDGESIVLRLGGANGYWFQIDERGIGDVLLERAE